MSQRVRTILSVLGFFVVLGILMSDRFEDMSDAIPESVYYYVFLVVLVGGTGLGFYSWWQHYNARKMHPTINRMKKWMEDPPWWLWPF